MRSLVVAALAGLLFGCMLAGCGSSSSVHRPAGSRRIASVPSLSSMPPTGTGQSVDAGGAVLTVTLVRVLDPLRGSGATLPRGDRAVGVVLRIANAGPSVYESEATTDVSLLPAGLGIAVLARTGACRTPLEGFENYITAGQAASGCVVFAVPRGAVVRAVQFAAQGRVAWTLRWQA